MLSTETIKIVREIENLESVFATCFYRGNGIFFEKALIETMKAYLACELLKQLPNGQKPEKFRKNELKLRPEDRTHKNYLWRVEPWGEYFGWRRVYFIAAVALCRLCKQSKNQYTSFYTLLDEISKNHKFRSGLLSNVLLPPTKHTRDDGENEMGKKIEALRQRHVRALRDFRKLGVAEILVRLQPLGRRSIGSITLVAADQYRLYRKIKTKQNKYKLAPRKYVGWLGGPNSIFPIPLDYRIAKRYPKNIDLNHKKMIKHISCYFDHKNKCQKSNESGPIASHNLSRNFSIGLPTSNKIFEFIRS